MISDVLSDLEPHLADAEGRIGAYLEDPATRGCYQDREILSEIIGVLGCVRGLIEAARVLRAKLDTPPSVAIPNP